MSPLGCGYLDAFQLLGTAGAAVRWLFVGAAQLLVPRRKGLLLALGTQGWPVRGIDHPLHTRLRQLSAVWDWGQW